MRQLLRSGLASAVLALATSVSGQTTYYIDDDAPLGGDGLSWASAFPFLQDALVIAVAGDEIRLAEGLYLPDHDSTWFPDGSLWRPATFAIPAGVAVRGGYAGMNAPDPDARDPEMYISELCGDLLADDLPDFGNRGDNSHHLITVMAGDVVTLDGMHLSRGNAMGGDNPRSGAGIYCAQGQVEVRDCILEEHVGREGGSVHLDAATGEFYGCTFRITEAGSAGALWASEGSTARFEDCAFSLNESGGGGAIVLRQADAVFINSSFTENLAWDPVGYDGSPGGAITCVEGSLELSQCAFHRNHAGGSGGAVHASNANVVIADCQFEDNFAEYGVGGALDIDGGVGLHFYLERCTFSNNTATANGAVHGGSSIMHITDCDFIANTATEGQAGAIGSGQNITNCRFIANSAAGGGGAAWGTGSGSFSNCVFQGNSADEGGAVRLYGDSQPPELVTFLNCSFLGNTASRDGGAVHANSRPQPVFVNCLFSGNEAGGSGGAVYNDDTSEWFLNCTVTNNDAADQGGGAYTTRGDITVANSIFWGNTDTAGILERAQISNNDLASPDVAYSNVEGWTFSYGGPGMLATEPFFEDPLGVDGLAGTEDDDLHLTAGSPCIDAGDNDAVQHPFDLDLNQRRADDPNAPDTGHGEAPVVDMGAYESASEPYVPCPGDLDGDRDVDQSDLGLLLADYGLGSGGDVDFDGDTDQADLGILLANYERDCD